MRRRHAALILVLVACRPNERGTAETVTPPSPEPAEREPPHAASVQIPPVTGPQCDGVDLDVVAACLRQAVTVVPAARVDESLDSVIADAAHDGVLDERCEALARSDGLRTASGHPLVVATTSSSWDHLGDGTARRYIDVRISCSCCTQVAAFTLVGTVGHDADGSP